LPIDQMQATDGVHTALREIIGILRTCSYVRQLATDVVFDSG